MNNLMQALIDLVTVLIRELAPILIGFVVWYAKNEYQKFILNKPENVRMAYEEAAKIGIQFAEILAVTGQEKLLEAIRVGELTLKKQGYKNVSTDVLKGYIEKELPIIVNDILQSKAQKLNLKRVLDDATNRG